LERVVFALPTRRPTSFGTWTFWIVDVGEDVEGGRDETDDGETVVDDEVDSDGAASFVFGVDCAHAVTASNRVASIVVRRTTSRLLNILPSPPSIMQIIVEWGMGVK